MTKNGLKTYPKWLKITFQISFDIVSVLIAYFGSLLLRFGAKIPEEYVSAFLITILPTILIFVLFLICSVYTRAFGRRPVSTS